MANYFNWMHKQLPFLYPSKAQATTISEAQAGNQPCSTAARAQAGKQHSRIAERKETMGERGEPYLVALLGEGCARGGEAQKPAEEGGSRRRRTGSGGGAAGRLRRESSSLSLSDRFLPRVRSPPSLTSIPIYSPPQFLPIPPNFCFPLRRAVFPAQPIRR